MRRREEAERRDRLRREEEDRMREARWVVKGLDNAVTMLTDDRRFDLSPPLGRRSFRGFNPVVEALVEQQLKEHRELNKRGERRKAKLEEEAREEEQEKAVSDADLSRRLTDMRVPAKRKIP